MEAPGNNSASDGEGNAGQDRAVVCLTFIEGSKAEQAQLHAARRAPHTSCMHVRTAGGALRDAISARCAHVLATAATMTPLHMSASHDRQHG